MTNKEKAIEIFRLLEENHINLFHDISKENFVKELNKFLEIADNLDDIHFDTGMSKLFALFKDAHTSYFVKSDFVNVQIKVIDDKYYLYDGENQLCEEIVMVNGFDIKEVIAKLKTIIPYEYESWARKCVADRLGSLYNLKMTDCENRENPNLIEFVLESGKKIVCKKGRSTSLPKPNYSFSINNNSVIVNYFKCKEIEGYPFKKFIEDIKERCKETPVACLVDLRGNTGGSSEIIYPLIDWLEENKIKTYVLMNGGVFSSGVFGLIDLKRYLNATLIGTDAGQSAHCYGECRWLKVGDKEFTCCKKYFNQTTIDTKQNVEEFPIKKVVDYLGPIKPDIYLEEKVEDVKLGIDGQLRDALEIIQKELEISKEIEKEL